MPDLRAQIAEACGTYSWHRTTAHFEQTIDAVLAVVEPAIRAAQAQALRDFADNHVHHQTAARVAEDLHARADEIEAGS